LLLPFWISKITDTEKKKKGNGIYVGSVESEQRDESGIGFENSSPSFITTTQIKKETLSYTRYENK
jgi:hypothetical protein